MKQYIMAVDQGTTSSRCILFDHNGTVCSLAQKEFTQFFPKPGWVEHDAMEIWSSQIGVMMEAMAKIGVDASQIAGIGITNQRETTIVWDKNSGKPVCPAIVWQCRRTADRIEQLKQDGMDEVIRRKTGLIPDAYFSATKIEWILDHVDQARERAEKGELLFGTVDSWLIWNLTRGAVHATDYTNASRTMLFDIHRKEWDQELLRYFRIPKAMLPKVRPSGFLYGHTSKEILGEEIRIAGAAGDQQAALFGQGCFQRGSAKNTYGTGCFLLMNTGKQAVHSAHGLLTTIAAGTRKEISYALEGSVFVGGAVIQWLRDQLGMIRSAQETEEVCFRTPDTGGMYLVPAFAGLGAPYWDQYARGCMVGLTRGTSRDQIVRAAVESMAYQTADVLEAMQKDSGLILNSLKVDGGASRNNFLMQFQADLLNATIQRPHNVESTALGAAFLAGLTVGYWNNEEEIAALLGTMDVFLPEMEDRKRTDLWNGWKKAVERAKKWE